jgi:uncharacterized membrane protein YdbT with pleckstrin-like domain
MTFLDRSLMPEEKILFQTNKHFIIFAYPVLWTVVALFFLIQNQPLVPGIDLPFINSMANLVWIPGFIAVGSWLNQALNYMTSRFVVTNKRIIMREGFFLRHAAETRLATVAEIKVDQSLLGRLFNFGTLSINSFGGGNEVFAYIADPVQFQRVVSGNLG